MASCDTDGCKGRPKATETLCKKCKTKKNEGENGCVHDDIIVNEVIWYIDQHRHAATKDNIIRAVSCFYDNEDMEIAKGVLISKFGEYIDAELKKSRRDSQQRSEGMRLCEDIIAILSKLDEHLNLVCVAQNWKKMLKCNPEEMTDLSVAERVAQFSAKFRAYDDALSDLRAQMMLMKESFPGQKVTLISDVVKQKADDTTRSEQNGPLVQKCHEKNQVIAGPSKSIVQRLNSRNDVSQPTVPVPDSPSTNLSSDGFDFQRDERRRQKKENNKQNPQKKRSVAGQSDNGGLRKSPPPTWHYFVYKVHQDDGVDEVREYVEKQNVAVADLVKTSHNEAKYNSFKLSVSKDFADTILNPDFWPKGIYIRRWHERHQKNNDTRLKKTPPVGDKSSS